MAPQSGAAPGTPPFQFTFPQRRIDWRTIEGLDLGQVIRTTDLDSLEKVLETVAYGSLRRQSHGEMTVHTMRRLFEVSQLTVQYLLYVQNRLASDVRNAKGQLESTGREVKTLQECVAQLRREAESAEREARHTRRMLRVALAQVDAAYKTAAPSAPPPPSLSVPPPDPEAAERLKRLEDGIGELISRKYTKSSSGEGYSSAPQLSKLDRIPLQEQAVQCSPSGVNSDARSSGETAKHVQSTQFYANGAYDAGAVASQQVQAANSRPGTAPSPPAQSSPTDAAQTSGYYGGGSRSPQGATFARYFPVESPPPLPLPPPRPLPSPAPRQPTASPPPASPLAPDLSSSSAAPVGYTAAQHRRQFLRELPYELMGHERPGVRSRFPHSVADLSAVRQELKAELEGELASELEAQGLDPSICTGLTPGQFLACMEALRQRQQEAASQMSFQDREREHYMRSTVSWHVDKVAQSVGSAAGGREKTSAAGAAEATNRQPVEPERSRNAAPAPPPPPSPPLPPPPFPSSAPSSVPYGRSHEHLGAPVEIALEDVQYGETDRFYSPLRHGSEPGSPASPAATAGQQRFHDHMTLGIR